MRRSYQVIIAVVSLAALLAICWLWRHDLLTSSGGSSVQSALPQSSVGSPAPVSTVGWVERSGTHRLPADTPADDHPTRPSPAVPVSSDDTATPVPRKPSPFEPKKIEDPEQYCSISGVVTNEQGNLVSGADVMVSATGFDGPQNAWYPAFNQTFINRDQHFQTTTGIDGVYEVTGIQFAGQAIVHAFTDFAVGNTKVQLRPGAALKDVNIAIAGAVTLMGRVLAPDGRPVPDACVSGAGFVSASGRLLEDAAGGNAAFTDLDGAFRLGFREAGLAVIGVHAPGHPPATFPDVPVGDPGVIDLELQAPASLSGQVTWADGRPAAGTNVLLSREWKQGLYDGSPDDVQPYMNGQSPTYVARVNAEGLYDIEAVAAGSGYVIQVLADGFRSLTEKDPIEFQPGETKTRDFTLAGEIAVKGHVYGVQTGRPLPEVYVGLREKGATLASSVSNAAEDNLTGFIMTGTAGDYKLNAFAGGTYLVIARYTGNAELPGSVASTKEIACDPGGTYEVDLQLPEPVTLPIRVIDAAGQPVPGAKLVTVQATAPQMLSFADVVGVTDVEGRSVVASFTPGIECWLEVSKPGYIRASTAKHTGSPGEVFPEETLVLFATAGIQGIALGPDGAPLTAKGIDIRVEAADYREHHNQYMPLDPRGAFTLLEGVPAANVTFTLTLAQDTPAATQDLSAHVGPIDCAPGVVTDLGPITFTPKPE